MKEISPYKDGECTHINHFDRNGIDTCLNCGMVYDTDRLEWTYPEVDD